MIKCNITEILKEKRLSITKVSKDTGLSRTTLTSLANNTSQGIQFDTLNTLLQYLNVSIENFLIHSKDMYEVECSIEEYSFNEHQNSGFINIGIKIKNGENVQRFYMYGDISKEENIPFLIVNLYIPSDSTLSDSIFDDSESCFEKVELHSNDELINFFSTIRPLEYEYLMFDIACLIIENVEGSPVSKILDAIVLEIDGIYGKSSYFIWDIQTLKSKQKFLKLLKEKYNHNPIKGTVTLSKTNINSDPNNTKE